MIIKTIVGRPITLFIVFALIVGFGIYSSLDLAIDLYPEINPPILIVFTNYTGAGPEEIEKTVTRILESSLSNVSNIEKMTSTSSEGSSIIQVSFIWGTDMSEAANDIRDKIEFVKSYLPEEATSPQIFKFDPSIIPILQYMVKSNRSAEELRDISEKIIIPRLEQTNGVAMASIMGGRERIISVEIPQNRLEAYNLTLTQIAQMLRGQNIQISAGSITEGSKNYLIRTSGEYQNIEEIKNTVIAYKSDTPSMQNPRPDVKKIRLRDIANVKDSFRNENMAVYINGQPGVYITIQKQSGTNSVRTAENVFERLPRIQSALPTGISMELLMDTTKIIKDSLSQVTSSALSAIILVVVILFIFLRTMKSTIIIGLSIPVSIIFTLMLMYFFKLTLNLMTLTGLVLGIGMLVDNSIVILENIYHYREKGTKPTAAAILGSQEMILPIVASTLTTIVVFAPVALFRDQLGMYGEMFSGLSFTVVISLTSSLIVALVLVPILTSKFFPLTSRKEDPLKGMLKRIDDVMARFFTGLNNVYKKALKMVLQHRFITIVAIAAIFLGSLVALVTQPFELLPNFQGDNVTVNMEMPIGTKIEITESILKQLELIVKEEVKGYKNIIVTAGQRSFFGFMGGGQSHRGSLTISLPPFRERIDTVDTVKMKLRKHFNDIPAAKFNFSGGMGRMSMDSPVDILIRTEDLIKGKKIADQIRDLLKEKIPEATEPEVNLNDGLPQIEILIDRDKAYDLRLNMYSIGQEIKANVDGITASRFKEGGSEYDIVVILDPEDRDAVPDLDKIFVSNVMGQRIPLASFCTLEKTTGPVSINRENQGRLIHVTAGIIPGTDLKTLQTRITNLIASEIPADDAVTIEFSGDWENLMKYGGKLVIILIISILLVFGVMAAQFESFLDPFIILFTMPLTLIGVIAIHVLLGMSFSLFTVVGLVVLVGIVVNNGIVLVDYTNLLHRRGFELIPAVIEAGGNRLRPVLMTTLTTALGLMPLALTRGEGIDLIRPIGVTILGGLVVSAFFTLFLIPVLYSLFQQARDKRRVKQEIRRQRRLENKKLAFARAREEEKE
ncbi:MAG: efflux RND transporter permease subunit [Spirochaetales bacterium]|nr:efflux RND transporter permease subunit [Spirochaetales bacterium]